MKKRKIISNLIIACSMLMAVACHGGDLPEGVVDTATFTAFLTEAHLIEGYVDVASRDNADSANYYAQAAYDSLYAKYGITPADYDSSINYYVHHPKLMEDIYARVVQNVRALQP